MIALDYALRKAINGREEELGFTIHPRRSRRVGSVSIADLEFADDVALTSDTVEQAQDLLISVEDQCGQLGLTLNSKRTVVLPFKISGNAELTTLSGEVVGVKEDFKYLGSYISSTGKDIDMRKAQAWRALHKLNNIWHSNMSDDLKRSIFVASVESILTYGCEAWTLTVRVETRLNGCYTRMLRKVLNVTWRERIPNEVLYGGLPPLSTKI